MGGWLSSDSSAISDNGSYQPNMLRILSDFIFEVIVGILLIEIFSGILTDTFARDRAQQEELSDIKKST
jgi:F0F1-type ATP synthase assembly protein I